jgi:hypothetical protein
MLRLRVAASCREEPVVKRLSPILALALLAVFVSISAGEEPPKNSLAQLEKAFTVHCGARLVFAVNDLPEGTYHDSIPALKDAERMRAAHIAHRGEMSRMSEEARLQLGLFE